MITKEIALTMLKDLVLELDYDLFKEMFVGPDYDDESEGMEDDIETLLNIVNQYVPIEGYED